MGPYIEKGLNGLLLAIESIVPDDPLSIVEKDDVLK